MGLIYAIVDVYIFIKENSDMHAFILHQHQYIDILTIFIFQGFSKFKKNYSIYKFHISKASIMETLKFLIKAINFRYQILNINLN